MDTFRLRLKKESVSKVKYTVMVRYANMERLAKKFTLKKLLDRNSRDYQMFVGLELPNPQQPRKYLHCACCLYRLGFGYDRALKYLGVWGPKEKGKLSDYIGRRRKFGLCRPPTRFSNQKRIGPRVRNRTPYIPVLNPKTRGRKPNPENQTLKKIKANLRSRFWLWFSETQHYNFIQEAVACDVRFLRHWLQSMFKRGMTWDNYGTYWHIDHRVPMRAFDLTNPEEIKKCLHFTNLHRCKGVGRVQPVQGTPDEVLLPHSWHPRSRQSKALPPAQERDTRAS